MAIGRLGKIASQSMADQARDQIREAIFEGKIKPEERLIIERIAAELGSSRTPVREALKALEADGIVTILPNKGAVVRRFDRQELYDRYSMRALLEGYTAEMACRARGKELADELEVDCDAMERKLESINIDNLDEIADLLKLSIVFRNRIRESSGSEMAGRLLEMLQMPIAYRLYYRRERERLNALLAFYRQLAGAFRDAQPKKVRRLIEQHLNESRDFLISKWDSNSTT